MFQLLLNDYPTVVIFLAGVLGAFTSDILKDNCLELPRVFEGKFYLGWIGGSIIGGVAGLCIDGSFITAFMAGFVGKDVVLRLVSNYPLSSDFTKKKPVD